MAEIDNSTNLSNLSASQVKIAPGSILGDPIRLRALEATQLLDSVAESAFDRLTNLARRMLGVPTVVFSLVDDRRQFFKSEIGLPPAVSSRRETPLTHSFCQWVVATGQPLRVDDATKVDLVCDNLAITELGVRSYFGVPIRDPQGYLLGAFAAIDSVVREWTDDDFRLLMDFGALAMSEIDLRLAAAEARRQADAALEAEALLAESEQRYRTALEGLNEVVFQTDLAGNWTFLSSVWESLTGSAVEAALGANLVDYVQTDDREMFQQMLDSIESQLRGRLRQELRFRRADGTYRWVEIRARKMIDASGVATGYSGTLFDISERYESLTMLTESEVRFRTMVECLGEGLIITDTEDRIQYVNARMAAMSGYAPRDLLGKRAYELLLPEAEWEPTRARNRRRTLGEAEQYETCFLKRDGGLMWVELHATPYFGTDGAVVGTLSAVSDISARKAAEQRLREITFELRRSNQALQEFASVASHDLQEPLRKIQAFGDRLRHKCQGEIGEEGLDYLDRMQSAAGRMQSLINDLLVYSRVSSKAQPFQSVDLNEVAGGVLSDLEARVHATGGTVHLSNLPVVTGDPMQIRQLLQNLIGNALKFHREDTPPVVRVEAEWIGGTATENKSTICRISIRDNGIGFEPKYSERVFEVFERLNARTEFEGTGMGLAICRRIVERHGGTIRASSEPGAGTTFTVDLPVQSHGEQIENTNVHRD